MSPVIMSGTVMSVVIARLASRGQIAYSFVANVVEQSIDTIRTVFPNHPKNVALLLTSLFFLLHCRITSFVTPDNTIHVVSFTGEKQAIDKYNESLMKAYRSSVQEGLAAGWSLGAVTFIIFSSNIHA
ncbi:hypothetical protein HS088_TW20G00309 [Tripterygium wilfordii]|uniref:ABC transmembrane type-1 domain-containing protein n=1 Tax=Tripterygium wilfordii TaxID=458696 RepID=A0A7J7C751_TRIWF|nr:hypothetical protein HS088_TW20G00309 [Tripterygium wilfordii]